MIHTEKCPNCNSTHIMDTEPRERQCGECGQKWSLLSEHTFKQAQVGK